MVSGKQGALPPSEGHAPEAKLQRRLGFWALAAYGIGDILGAGIYALVGKIAGIAGEGAWISFAVAMGVATLTALSYAELGSRLPKSGGEASFCQSAFRRPALSFLIGWLVLASGVVSLATVARAFAGYLLGILPDASAPVAWAVPAGFLAVLAGINFRGIRESSATNIVCTLVEAVGLLIVAVTGLAFLGRGSPAVGVATEVVTEVAAEIAAEIATGAPWVLTLQGSALAFFAFIGFEDMVNVAEEVKHPERNLPRAILLSLAVAAGMVIHRDCPLRRREHWAFELCDGVAASLRHVASTVAAPMVWRRARPHLHTAIMRSW